jgi:hypothetical protein
MKTSFGFVLKLLVAVSFVSLVSCESTEPPKKKKVSASSGDDLSSLPWNRPRSFEGSSGIGRALPQSR